MASPIRQSRCLICEKEKATSKCTGCLEDFCFNHLVEHRQQLNRQLDQLENNRNLFRQTLTEQIKNPQRNSFIQEINQWEKDSINKIQQTANEARELLLKHTNEHLKNIETKLTKLTKEFKEIREENDFNEIELNQLKRILKQLEEELNKPSTISIQQDSSPFIKKISVIISSQQSNIHNISINTKWTQNGTTVAAGKGHGHALNQLHYPYSIYIDDEQTIYVVDRDNHRIVEWKNGATSGQIVAGGNSAGNQNDQLNYPGDVIIDRESDSLIICDQSNNRVVRWPRRNGTSGQTIISNINCWGLAMDNNGYLYVSDISKQEVRRWKLGETEGVVVAGGNGVGNRLDQLNGPYFIFVDQDYSVYVSDMSNHRVMKWMKDAKEGIVVAGGNGIGNSLTQLSHPLGIVVDALDTLYVVDCYNHRVIRWLKGATQGSVIVGGNGEGGQANQLNYPFDLSFDRANNLYVVEKHNSRVQKFLIEQNAN